MNDNDMNEMMKKAQEMMANNQVPDDIKNMVQMLQNKSTKSDNKATNINSSTQSNISSNVSTDSNTNNFNTNFDMATLMKMQGLLSKLKTVDNDDMTKLLLSLKPYMREGKKEKIDEYISLIKMGKMTQLLESLGGNPLKL